MADYALTGKKGTGKSKNAVRIIRDVYLKQNRTVASNLDLYLSPLLGKFSRQTYIRLPDKPSAFDLEAAGHGNPASYDEDNNGGLVLDEVGTWVNTRSFADKDRAAMLDFLAHARKHGWDCFYIMQNIVQVDKQLREAFVEYVVRHVRYDRVKVPFVGGLLQTLLGDNAGYLPRFHRAITRIGVNPQDLQTDAYWFRDDDLHACYDTRQVFQVNYPHGTHSVLSPWHLEGRFLEAPALSWQAKLVAWVKAPPRVYKPLPPLVAPCPARARVMALVKRLPVDQRFHVLQLYERGLSVRAGGA